MDAKRIDELAALLTRYRNLAKPPASFLEDMAIEFRQRGQLEQAIEFYRRALEVEPEREVSVQALAELTK